MEKSDNINIFILFIICLVFFISEKRVPSRTSFLKVECSSRHVSSDAKLNISGDESSLL